MRLLPAAVLAGVLLAASLTASAPAYAAVGAWTQQASNVVYTFYDVSCPSATTCFAVASAGWIDRTTDGGATWTATNAGAGTTILSISCPTTATCFTADNTGRVLHTTDGGTTWTAQTLSQYSALSNISCPSVSVCYTANGYTTKDGGATWTQPQVVAGQDVSCPSVTMCIAVRSSGTAILETTDGGATWTVQASASTTPNAVFCLNTSFCVVATNGPSILKTTNGGTTWTTWTSPGGGIQFLDVACLSPSFCMAPFGSSSLWQTSDGGMTWSYSDTGTGSNLYAITCPGAGGCIAVGGNLNGGTIARYQAPVPTITGQPSSGVEGTSGSVTVATISGGILPYSATIDWGDGISSPATVTSGGVGGGYSVTGTHAYAEEGSYTATVTAIDGGASTVSATSTVSVRDASLTGSGNTIVATEGANVSGVVATFIDADPAAVASDYSATIDWQDGSSSAGTISANPDGSFSVSASHTYSEEKTFYAAVTITDATAKAIPTATVNVADSPLTGSGKMIAATEGASFSGPVSSFTDGDPGGTASDYSATITWGDGATSAGTIAANASGGFDVNGTHTYTEEGNRTATVSITDVGGANASASASVAVADTSIVGTARTISSQEGTSFSGIVASFSDGDPAGATSDYSATITWGDGHTSTGTVTIDPSGGFDVSGASTYAEEGAYAVGVAVTDAGGASVTVASTANVTDAALTASVKPISASEGTAFSGVVANITDGDPAGTAADYSGTITWGDGATSAATIAVDPNGGFDISGSHTYAEEGNNQVSVNIADGGGASTTASGTATVNDAGLSAVGKPISATEGSPFAWTVASFSDADPAGTATDYSATISWGDGSSSAGTITANASGGFDVSGSHTFAEGGNPAVSVNVTDAGGGAATATSTATIGDPALTASAVNISATEGASFAGMVATFTDADASTTVADYAVNISWGDGHTSAGTVASDGHRGYIVSGSNAYAEDGSATVSISVTDSGGGSTSATGTATIHDATISATAAAVNATEGATFSGPVATITDNDPAGAPADYTATITWGDGHKSAGTIAANGLGGFTVSGNNTYAEEGTDQMSVTVTDAGGSSTTVTTTANVVDAGLTTTAKIFNATEGIAFSGVVATFSDANPGATASDYTASINWGDGHISAGTVASDGAGAFNVTGTNTYAEEGPSNLTVTITDAGGTTATASPSASVLDATLSANPQPLHVVEGATFSGTVLTFTDADPLGSASEFTASINWGDGHTTSGTVTGSNGTYAVAAGNTYTEEGTLNLSVTINDAGGANLIANTTAVVADAGLTASAKVVSATEGAPFSGVVASFTDADPAGTATDFTATISWGNGHSSSGTIAANGTGGFNVSGVNTYAEEGTQTVKVTITDSGGATAVANSTANIGDAALTVKGKAFTATRKQAFTTTVASFTDADPSGVTTDYTGTINWGDGSAVTSCPTSLCSFSLNSGTFSINGTHTYTSKGTYLVTISVKDSGGYLAPSVTSTVTVS